MSKTTLKEIRTSHGTFSVRDNERAGFPVVLLHGWPESSYCWEEVIKYLPTDYRLIRPDLRGLGDSDRSLERPAYQKDEMAKDIWRVLDKMGIKQVILVGHDWGGVVAQEMAWSHPERVSALCVMNILIINNQSSNLKARNIQFQAGNRANWYQLFYQQEGLPEHLIPGNEEVWLRYFLRMSQQRFFPEETIEEYIRTFRIPETASTSANYYRALSKDQMRWASYQGTKFVMPALYIYGTRDTVIIPAFLENIEDCFEQITVKQLDAGHFVHEELPKEVGKLLTGFFQEIAVNS